LNSQPPKECRIHLRTQILHQMTSSSLVIWEKNSAGYRSLRTMI
jgi:hypothetical protein